MNACTTTTARRLGAHLGSVLLMAALVCGPIAAADAAGGGGGGGGGGDAAAVDQDYAAGLAAAQQKDWPQVIARMRVAVQRNPGNADAWNELGHAYRLTGDMDSSFRHYQHALQLNPRHKGAHEYLGEAYLQVDKLAEAEQELKTLGRLCPFGCEEYDDLKSGIERYKRERAKTGSSVTMQ